jgi:hypothetical protein
MRAQVEFHGRGERLTQANDVVIACVLPRRLGDRCYLRPGIGILDFDPASGYALRLARERFDLGIRGIDCFLGQGWANAQ